MASEVHDAFVELLRTLGARARYKYTLVIDDFLELGAKHRKMCILYRQNRGRHDRGTTFPSRVGKGSALTWVAATLVLIVVPVSAGAQTPAAPAPLVFEGVTVVDVEQGKLLPNQRVVIVGNRIETVDASGRVKVPKGAQIVDAKNKYLIPGLWDMHTHSENLAYVTYPFFVAHGVTGIRDAASKMTLDTLIQWRREILAGTRIGPPRQILSGPHLNAAGDPEQEDCSRAVREACIRDSAEAVQLVDSLKAAGADMLKMYHLTPAMYFVLAAKARRVGMPFGGHLNDPIASDSGATLFDHSFDENRICVGNTATVEGCKPMVERFARNGTWWVPTLNAFALNPFNLTYNRSKRPASKGVVDQLNSYVQQFWAGTVPSGNWLQGATKVNVPDKDRSLLIAEAAGFPIVAGTDVTGTNQDYDPAGLSLHGELAVYVAEGLSPLSALQAATLNPAKWLRATDSLGTVASGKLADLVLLDANPLEDITNTLTVRAVVANGRYFDRVALDKILDEARAKAKADNLFADHEYVVNP